jgi:succinyl-CoA synthetase beta subunit
MLRTHRIPVPPGELVNSKTASEAACRIGFPVALKLVNSQLPHKTEAGVVRLNLASEDQVRQAAHEVLGLGSQALGQQVDDQLLVEKMLNTTIAELLVGVQNDPQFGLVMTLAGGGTLVELMADSTTILLPTDRSSLRDALASLKVMRLLEGYRNRPHADVDQLLDTLVAISEMSQHLAHELIAMDINPLLVTESGCFAADTLIQLSHKNLLAMP